MATFLEFIYVYLCMYIYVPIYNNIFRFLVQHARQGVQWSKKRGFFKIPTEKDKTRVQEKTRVSIECLKSHANKVAGDNQYVNKSTYKRIFICFHFRIGICLCSNFKIKQINQLHAVFCTQQGRQREPSVKTLRSPLSAEFQRQGVLSGRTQRRSCPRQQTEEMEI